MRHNIQECSNVPQTIKGLSEDEFPFLTLKFESNLVGKEGATWSFQAKNNEIMLLRG